MTEIITHYNLGLTRILVKKALNFSYAYLTVTARTLFKNRVESALTEPTLSHHGTCDVAYRGFKLAFNKTKNFALLGLGCYSM
ncbi:MAG: hypothetical protein GY821_13345, partial [Gammaproteobacteria bacterium]|nr:hypothetical protein [Gammaproteobacteria bacterium]